MRRVMTGLLPVLAGAGLLAGCSAHGAPAPARPAPALAATSSSAPQSSPAGSASTATSAAPTAAAQTPTPPAPATSSAASSAAGIVHALPGCPTDRLSLQAQRAASANQQSFISLVFTNTGSAACSLAGFPGVSLLAGGAQVGPDAQRTQVAPAAVDVQPGGSAHATLAVLTSCDAPRADTVRVYPPNQTAALTAPVRVYGCSSEISPVQPGSGS